MYQPTPMAPAVVPCWQPCQTSVTSQQAPSTGSSHTTAVWLLQLPHNFHSNCGCPTFHPTKASTSRYPILPSVLLPLAVQHDCVYNQQLCQRAPTITETKPVVLGRVLRDAARLPTATEADATLNCAWLLVANPQAPAAQALPEQEPRTPHPNKDAQARCLPSASS